MEGTNTPSHFETAVQQFEQEMRACFGADAVGNQQLEPLDEIIESSKIAFAETFGPLFAEFDQAITAQQKQIKDLKQAIGGQQ